jgi:hypothetical protein
LGRKCCGLIAAFSSAARDLRESAECLLTIPQGLLATLESEPNIGIAFLINPAAKLPMRLLKFESGLDGALLKQYAATCPH